MTQKEIRIMKAFTKEQMACWVLALEKRIEEGVDMFYEIDKDLDFWKTNPYQAKLNSWLHTMMLMSTIPEESAEWKERWPELSERGE